MDLLHYCIKPSLHTVCWECVSAGVGRSRYSWRSRVFDLNLLMIKSSIYKRASWRQMDVFPGRMSTCSYESAHLWEVTKLWLLFKLNVLHLQIALILYKYGLYIWNYRKCKHDISQIGTPKIFRWSSSNAFLKGVIFHTWSVFQVLLSHLIKEISLHEWCLAMITEFL